MASQHQATGPGTPGPVSIPVPGSSSSPASVSAYKRASRKGAPKKFACEWPTCDKVYSRQEHLQRHQLNHDPKQVFRCDVPDCNQMFVRQDLLLRHKKRHSTSYVPRNRASSFSITAKDSSSDGNSVASPGVASNGQSVPPPTLATSPAPSLGTILRPMVLPQHAPPLPTMLPRQTISMPRNASVLLSPDSTMSPQSAPASSMVQPPAWSRPMDSVNVLPPKPNYYSQPQVAVHEQSTFMPFADLPVANDTGDMSTNFGLWLFDNERTYGDFNVAELSFVEAGLESTFNNNIHYDHESLTSRSQVDLTPPRHSDSHDELISETRRLEIVSYISMFSHNPKRKEYATRLGYLLQESGNDLPNIRLVFLHECVRVFWEIVSPRLPIIHHPTFSPTRCHIHLLLVMIALGASQIHRQSPAGEHEEYKALADLVIPSVRLEIIDVGAVAPVELWAAQALLLIEFYEKMCSTRKLHEKGHMFHSVTLNLLRRGNPLIGKAGLESPPDEQNSVDPSTDDQVWWIRWAETEAMHRVVFAAFMMDIIHAAMFGHTADMAPHEIRLPLPCDEALWSAPNHESVRQSESNLRMYGVERIFFLEGLKEALHGRVVRTHSFGRMIIMCGLLSVGWHLRHRETHLKWLDIAPNASETRDKWCQMLLKAFDDWKTSFDDAIGSNSASNAESSLSEQQSSANGLIQSAAVLYHLAHISLYVDIIDCQVYAGAKRLVGRKVSSQDVANVNTRMAAWAAQPLTKRAISHAFKLLHRILVDPRQKKISMVQEPGRKSPGAIQYSTRADSDPHRPWIMYYATLSIWSYAQALKGQGQLTQSYYPGISRRGAASVPEYLSTIASLPELDAKASATLCDGLLDLLDVVYHLLVQSHSELLQEACHRLVSCKKLMGGGGAT